MPDLKQALKDFVATSNSGKYADEATLLSKFPELKGYDVQSLRDFVATSNSGKYTTEDEVFNKFPEFAISTQPEVKKKVTTVSPSEDTFLASQKQLPSFEISPLRAEQPVQPVQPEIKKEKLLKNLTALEEMPDRNAYLENLGTKALSGLTSLEKMVASIPESIINVASLPQNALAWATGWDIAANADTFKKTLGISNPILDKLNEEEKRLGAESAKFNKERYESTGIVDNIQKGNYADAFELLGSSIVESAPVSVAMMMGGATLAPAELAAISTAGFLESNREQLGEENPDMSEVEKTVKALGMSAAETVFESIGTGTIGQVYKDIVKKEGAEAGKEIFRSGLVDMYKNALKKYGAPIGLLGEGVEEAATQITQNVISGKPAFEGAADAFVTGAGSGVVFATPITAINAKNKITNTIQTYQSKSKINTILKDTDTNLEQVYNVPKDTPITPEQIEIANTNKSRDILVKNLDKKVKDGDISQDDAKQSLYVFDKIQQVSNAVKDLNVTNTEKAEIATLLSKRNQLTTDIQNKDDVLVAREKQEIADINKKIQDIVLASKPEVVAEAVVVETPEVAEKRKARIAELDALTAPGGQLSVTTPEWAKAVDELQTLKKEQDAIQKQATNEGVLRSQQPEVGLQQMGEGNQEPQVVTTRTQEVAPEVGTQEVVRLDGLTEKNGEFNGTLENLVSISTDNLNPLNEDEEMIAWNNKNKAKKENNLTDKEWAESILDVPSSEDPINATLEPDGKIVVTDGHHRLLAAKILKKDLAVNLKVNGYTNEEGKPTISEYLTQVSSKTQPTTQIQKNAEPTTKPTGGPIAGNRLFNKPIKTVSEIANRYYKRVFGTERPRYFGSRGLDEARGKRLAKAFIDMKHNPNDPEVKASYEALAKETLEQYQAFLDAGYTIEINNEEPYASSQDMIEDLRNNKRIKIFSTESGFGSKKITKKQRQDNPLLAKTELKDVNGKPLLVNDVFRAIHDFFGHAELGNSFGPKGEENAWNVHARMFSPLARRAMTTETRGQNSFVNFSGVNEKIEKDREEARKLREAGDLEGAKKLVDKIYEEGSFAEQKIGLLPEEFSQLDVKDIGDISMRPEGLQEISEAIEQEQFIPMNASEVKTDAFTKENAIDYEEDEKETESGRTVTYISSLTVEARNADGDAIGTITKLTDEDKIFSFIVDDIDGNPINKGDAFDTLGEAKKALADNVNKIQKKEFEKEAKKKAKAAEKAVKKVAPKVEVITETIEDLLELDPTDKTTLEKISSTLDKVVKDIDKFEKENLGVNIALPIMKTIIKAIKALVDVGISLQEAIKRISEENNVKPKDVVDGINAISQITPIQKEYDALMSKADELIARQKKRNIEDAKIVKNLDIFIRNSEAYKNATDAQKKIMEREARNKMGEAPKRAVSIGRVLGALKDITNISRAEKMLVIKQIRDLSRDAAKDLANEIKELAKAGTITVNQAANVIAKFGKVNMLNEVSVSNFVDYMSKVFADAEYVSKIDQAKSILKTAKKNIATKIGIAEGLMLPLQKLFSINPTMIPETSLDRYLELVNMFGERKAVLSIEEKSAVTKDVESILTQIDEEQSVANELADRFYSFEDKVFDDDGKLKYAETIDKMVEAKVIDEKEADIMRKYRSDIAPQVGRVKMTEQEISEEKADLLKTLDKIKVVTSGLPTKDERKLANRLKDLISTSAIEKLSNTDLKNLLKVLDNINNNYIPHYAQLMVEKLTAINNAKSLTSAIKKSVIAPLSGLYSRIKSSLTKRGAIEEMIRRNPLFNVDQLFGDYKTKDIFNAVLNKAAEGEANFKAELKKVQNILEKAEEKVAESFELEPNAVTMSKFKMMTYMIQLENDSNKGSKQVNPASEYLKATIKHIDAGKSNFGERDATMLQEILTKYTDADGNIDNEKLYKSFNQAEKNAIKDIRGVNESLREKAEYTAAIIRGDRINPLTNYVHLNVLHEFEPNDLTAGTSFINEYNNSMRPSTKAKSLIARTGKVNPLNFDIFASAQRGAKFVLMDYNLTEAIRTARKTINQTIANFEEEGRIPKEKREIINAINSALEETIKNTLTNSFVTNSLADEFANYVNKQGYRAVLAGTSRFVSELSSNIGFAIISDPKAFITGIENRGIVMSTDAPLVMENVGSKQTTRIFPTDTLSGKLIDTNILQQTGGIKGGKAKNGIANKIQQIWNLSGKKYTNTIELIADTLISTPDKMIMRPMWFGSFANEFKNIAGENVNFEKIAANDEEYMKQYKAAIEKAKTTADERSVMVGATDNPFMGILKGTVKPEQGMLLKGFNNFNNFMSKFLIFEYVTARTAINAAMGNGSLTRKQGVAVLGAVTTRMVTYGLITQMLGTGLMGLFFDDQEPEDEKSFMQKLGQQLTSAFTSLLFGRDFGNATKAMINIGLEDVNEKYLDFLREGEYDPYKDAIQYSIVPPEKQGKQRDLWDMIQNMGGAFGPSLKTADFIARKIFESEKKKEEAIARREKEINVRIPLEILGNAGFVPLYKDIRKAVMKEIYSGLEKADKNAADKKQAQLERLHGYQNQEDMKRYDPELWDRTFGPNAPDYNVEQAKKQLKKTKDSVEKAMKDEIYNYTPTQKESKGGLKKLY